MASAIKFGTSGWRAIVADEFTVENIRLAVAGIAEYVKTQPGPHRVLVGRDPRFLGESFVDLAARVLAGAGAHVVLAARRLDRLEALAGELEGALAVRCDVTESADSSGGIGRVRRSGGLAG